MKKRPKEKTSRNQAPDRPAPLVTPEQIVSLLSKPLSLRGLLKALKLPARRREALGRALHGLAEQGTVRRVKGGLWAAAGPYEPARTLPPATVLTGRLSQKKPEYAFILPDAEGQPDVYVGADDLNNALPGDRVSYRVTRSGRDGRAQGKVTAVLERGRARIVGTFRRVKTGGSVRPDGPGYYPEFIIPASETSEAQPGDKVVAQISSWPEGVLAGRARVCEVLGKPAEQPGLDITLIVRRLEIPDAFSERAIHEAAVLAQEPGPAEAAGRLDLRAERIVTIDGEDARDFDDAVSCEDRPGGGWRLGVHIADVSHYLREGTPLDLEARERGTSVYLPDRVLHMLPDPLSCGVCSLRPGVDRLTVSAFMDVEPDGRIAGTRFTRSVIHSAGRLTYNQVEAILQGTAAGDNPAVAFVSELRRLHKVSLALRRERVARGSLDFDLAEAKVILGPEGRVTRIERRVSLDSHRLIEDCMVAANEAVAAYLARTDTPSLYRVHDAPSGEKLTDLQEFLTAYGYTLGSFAPKQAAKAFQQLLASWQGKPEQTVLNMALLRSMKLAVYSPRNIGHFGLGSRCYTHFTSPIRRYPDLIVHRCLTERLAGAMSAERLRHLRERLPVWGETLSLTERRAEKAEREAVRLKQAQFMAGKIGEEFAGTISNATNFGFFVELDEHFVEGLVRIQAVRDDYYVFDDRKRFWRGTRAGRTFNTGDAVRVRVVSVDPEAAEIELALAEAPARPATAAWRGPRRPVKSGTRRRR